jgi:LysR family glycine cleavage system transcriptional activator
MVEPVPKRLPPLRGLEAFAVAGRMLNFTKAAGELNITLSALSRRIKSLEDDLGLRLFERGDAALRLTAEGARYLGVIAPAFDDMRAATMALRAPDHPRLLIATLQSFAQNWLFPRLPDFRAAHPEIDLQFATGTEFADFARDDVDLAIRLSRPHWPGLDVDILFHPEILPVCTAEIAAELGENPAPAALAEYPLLHSAHLPAAFLHWFESAGQPLGARPRDQKFDSMNLLYEATAASQGIGLGLDVLLAPYLESGRLVAAHGHRAQMPWAYCLLARPSDRRRPVVAAFRRWLLDQARP